MKKKSIELFAGAGGLALGVSAAGFEHEMVVELDRNACDTIRKNTELRVKPIASWPLVQADVRTVDFKPFEGIDLVAGGPPCQPFSIGGKHKGHADRRNLFPEVVRVVRETKPRAILVENVKGLMRPSFAEFFEHVVLQLTYPELTPRDGENWRSHLARLERYHTKGKPSGLHYRVVFQTLNAANYGVPQRRERVFIVGFRSDVASEWSFPLPTHSLDGLLRDQWVTGDYWERHRVAKKERPAMPAAYAERINRIRDSILTADGLPWRTVRDAIAGLPDPRRRVNHGVPNHVHNPGARVYPGHSGSPLDEPAKTLKAGDHGVPGGENMMAYPDGSVRYFTVRESARLQTFPDEIVFAGSWTESMRQLGNAVPVVLAHRVASGIASILDRRGHAA
ncbi:MAG: DNA cytosine methyltransferase [Candidatus Methylomirabilis oxygeniifera]|nr:MAG: DNA cytosine methyltransferase [Candidatus Methylomirabilis oxyfera]